MRAQALATEPSDLGMADPNAIDTATRRLAQALDALDAAVERRQDVDKGGEAMSAQLHTLGADRSRLAAELDHAAARAKELEGANREIARRIDVAMESIQSVLDSGDR